jgi:tRNA threonylcarbamoyladenosine biosynthesis protein TsaB
MIALAIETATDRLSVALGRPGAPPLEATREGARQHAAALLPMVERLLSDAGITLLDVGVLALADGPGSFTGLRVGAAVVKALARSRPGLPVQSASTLMVRGASSAPPHGARVLVVTSALRGELYAASYRFDLPTGVTTLVAPGLATPETLHRETPDLIVADGPDKLVDRLADQFAAPLIRGPGALPSAVALLALIGVPGGALEIASLNDWEPEYGRPAEAQVRWEATHGRPLSNPARDPR